MHSQSCSSSHVAPPHPGSLLYTRPTNSQRCNIVSNARSSLTPCLPVSGLQGRADGSQKVSLFKGLLKKSQALRAYRSRPFQLSFVCRDEYSVRRVPRLPEVSMQVNAAHPGQQQVQDEQKRFLRNRMAQESLGRVEGLYIPVSHRSHESSHGPENRRVIVNDEYGAVLRHHRVPVISGCLHPSPLSREKGEGWRLRRKEVVSTDLTDNVSRVGHEKEDGPWSSTGEKLEKAGRGRWIPRQCEGGMSFSLSASCTSSAREPACIFFITRARWSLTVFSTIPSSRAICLFSLPATTR